MVTMMKMLKKADILLILALIILSILPLAGLTGQQPDNVYADITVDGKLERRIPLSAHQGRERPPIGFISIGRVLMDVSLWVWAAVIGAILLSTACGIMVDRVAYRPLRDAPRISALISSIGVSFLSENLAIVIFTAIPRPVEQPEWPWQARERLSAMWYRIWHAPARMQPAQPAAPWRVLMEMNCALTRHMRAA